MFVNIRDKTNMYELVQKGFYIYFSQFLVSEKIINISSNFIHEDHNASSRNCWYVY